MVLPEGFAHTMQRLHGEIHQQGHLVTHMALAEFIRQGHCTKHIRKMRVVYARRRDWLRKLVIKYLGRSFLAKEDSHAGLHLVLHLPSELDDVEIASRLKEVGILCEPLSRHYSAEPKHKGLLLGYAGVEEAAIQKAFFEMLLVLRKFGVA